MFAGAQDPHWKLTSKRTAMPVRIYGRRKWLIRGPLKIGSAHEMPPQWTGLISAHSLDVLPMAYKATGVGFIQTEIRKSVEFSYFHI